MNATGKIKTQSNIKKESETEIFDKEFTRRSFLKSAALISAVFLSACSDVRIFLGLYPDKYKNDRNLIDRVLNSFVDTIIPGADENGENLIKIFKDEFYPFHRFCGFFVYDICRRSKELFDTDEFSNLSLKKRTEVIENAIEENEDKDTVRIYEFAVYLSQVSFYAGIYDDSKGCSLIEFKGRNKGYLSEEMTYSGSNFYLAPEITFDGNFN